LNQLSDQSYYLASATHSETINQATLNRNRTRELISV
jgi:hypothetical protein